MGHLLAHLPQETSLKPVDKAGSLGIREAAHAGDLIDIRTEAEAELAHEFSFLL